MKKLFLGILILSIVAISGCLEQENTTDNQTIYKQIKIFDVNFKDVNNEIINSKTIELEKNYSFKLEVKPVEKMNLQNVSISISSLPEIKIINKNEFPVKIENFGNEKRVFEIRLKAAKKVGGNICISISGLKNNHPFERDFYFGIKTEGLDNSPIVTQN